MRTALAAIGAPVVRGARTVGALTLVFGRVLYRLPSMNIRELLRESAKLGFASLPLTLGVAMLAGATVVVQTGLYVERFNARSFLGWAASYAVLWEFGPLLMGLLMAARVGARNAAELATLKVGGQLEGLRGISLDPFALLIAPRVVAILLSILSLSMLTFVAAIAFEAFAARLLLSLPFRVFLGNMADMLAPTDIVAGLCKSASFGLAIALVSTAVGIRAEGGARAVGQATAAAVVYSAGAIFFLDFALTALLTRVLG